MNLGAAWTVQIRYASACTCILAFPIAGLISLPANVSRKFSTRPVCRASNIGLDSTYVDFVSCKLLCSKQNTTSSSQIQRDSLFKYS